MVERFICFLRIIPVNLVFSSWGFVVCSAIMCYIIGKDEEIHREIVDRSSCYNAHCLPLHSTLTVLISVRPENAFLNSK